MRLRLMLGLILLSAAVPARAQTPAATPYAYDGFSSGTYLLGTALVGQNGGTGFSSAYSPASDTVVDFTTSNGLAHPGLVVTGNSITASGFAKDYRSLSLQNNQDYGATNGTVFASFLIKPVESSTDDWSYGGIGFASQSPIYSPITKTTGNAHIFVGDLQGQFGVEPYGGGGSLSNVSATTGAVTLLVVRITFQTGADQVDLFVNPSLTDWTSSTPASATYSGTDFTFNQIYFEQWERNYALDEFRLGSTFASVAPYDNVTPVPEPATYIAGALVCAAMFWLQRQRLSRLIPLRAKRTLG